MTQASAPPAPPFCPNPNCPFHRAPTPAWRWVRTGYYPRQHPPHRIQRYQCRHCRRHFSQQTFLLTYWLRRPELLLPTFHRLVGGSGFRQIAREFDCSPQTIATHSARLGRHCLLFHEQHRPHRVPPEPLVLDTFVSFEYSQFHPTGFHLLAGQRSHFFHGFTDSELRRSGAMTARQQRTRARLEARHGRPDPRSIEHEVAALLDTVAAGPAHQPLVLHTDQHQDYPRALRRLPQLRLEHRTTPSRAARTPRNPLFAINLLDLLLRHSGANHKRETIAFSKRRQSAAERLWVTLAWRNYVKSFSERTRGPSPAMRAGVCERRWQVPELLRERLFPTRVRLPPRWATYYWRKTVTRRIPHGLEHRRVYAR